MSELRTTMSLWRRNADLKCNTGATHFEHSNPLTTADTLQKYAVVSRTTVNKTNWELRETQLLLTPLRVQRSCSFTKHKNIITYRI